MRCVAVNPGLFASAFVVRVGNDSFFPTVTDGGFHCVPLFLPSFRPWHWQAAYMTPSPCPVAWLLMSLTLVSLRVTADVTDASAGSSLGEEIRLFQTWFETHYNAGEDGRRVVAAAKKSLPVYVELRPAPGMRMGVFAKQDISPEDVYLAVPPWLVISSDNILDGFDEEQAEGIVPSIRRIIRRRRVGRSGSALVDAEPYASFREAVRERYEARRRDGSNRVGLPWNEALLALFLIHEKLISGPKSFFWPYLQLLPEIHVSPMFFEKADFAFLRGTLMESKAAALKRTADQEFDWLKKYVFDPLPSVFRAFAFSRVNYHWAKGILSSRMIWWDGEPHLVPMLDMINCLQGPPPYDRRVHETKRDDAWGDRAVTRSPWYFDAGGQVFENYGQPNPTYFLYHGFSLGENHHDCAQIQLTRGMTGSQRTTAEARLRAIRITDDQCVSPTKYDVALQGAAAIVEKRGKRGEVLGTDGVKAQRQALVKLAQAIKAHLREMNTVEQSPVGDAQLAANLFRQRQAQLLSRTLESLRDVRRQYMPKKKTVSTPDGLPKAGSSDLPRAAASDRPVKEEL